MTDEPTSILRNDCLPELRKLGDASIDFICTDPPYGYSFLGHEWDDDVPPVEVWQECLRVLKPGAFAAVMSAPRSDVQCEMISRLQQAGFRTDFTPLYWAYRTGFPHATNVGLLAKRRGHDSLSGAYGGAPFKPAVEVILLAMKPMAAKTYLDQALSNGKGVSWLDDGRIPSADGQSRFPANLIVQDQALGQHSPSFDLDAWSDTLPFLVVPKPSKREKNEGLDQMPDQVKRRVNSGGLEHDPKWQPVVTKNIHATVKPVKLMAYLITLFSREGDTVLDPFVGSGTTVVAAKQLRRVGIGIERELEYAEIAAARVFAAKPEPEQTKLVA